MGLRIEAFPVGGGPAFVIADGTNHRGPGGRLAVDGVPSGLLSGRFEAEIPRVLYLDAAQSTFLAHPDSAYLQSGSIPLVAEYEFEFPGDNFAFIGSLQHAVPPLANLQITFGRRSFVIPNVALRPIDWQMVGEVSCRLAFPCAFGLINKPLAV